MELRPFRSIRFSPRVIRERGLSNVFAPPYDQISPERQDQLYARAPENIVRVTYPKKEGPDPYAEAAKTLADWLAGGILEKEKRPALWTYRQTFKEGGKTIVRDALVGLVKLEEYERGTIRPHERTLAKPKEDRLALLSATKADLELLFLLTRAPLSAALSTRRAPNLTATDDDGVRHDAFRISDYAAHVELQGLVKNAESIIADGHHRYETALAFSKDPAAEKMPGAKYKLCAIVDMESPGVIVRPIHRLLSGMPDWRPVKTLHTARDYFELRELGSAREAYDALEAHSRRFPAFVLYAPPGKPVLMTLREKPESLPWPEGRSEAWKALDVAALEVAFFDKLLGIRTDAIAKGERISFMSDTDAAIAAVDSGRAQAAILMRATTVSDVDAVVGAGDRLPQKSTHFFPKMYSGIFGVALEDAVY
jgi:uncharacterized protein (DUF1015 family)